MHARISRASAPTRTKRTASARERPTATVAGKAKWRSNPASVAYSSDCSSITRLIVRRARFKV